MRTRSGSERSGVISALKVCGSSRDLRRGRKIHWDVIQSGDFSDIKIATTLISMYAKCGSLADARAVFERLPCHHAVSWTNLILGYAANGEEALALEIFTTMKKRGVSPEDRTFMPALAACSGLSAKEQGIKVGEKLVKIASLEQGMALHSEAGRKGFDKNLFVRNTLINMYAKCGSLEDAVMAFTRMEAHDVVAWNALIAAYVGNGEADFALESFSRMLEDGRLLPDSRTFTAVLMACSSRRNLEEVTRIHSIAGSTPGCMDLFVANTLLGAYAKCGSLPSARAVFHKMPFHNVVSWTTLIQAEVESGNCETALEVYDDMKIEGCHPNPRTFVAVLTACAKLAAEVVKLNEEALVVANCKSLHKTKTLHSEALQRSCVDLFVGNVLIDSYAGCGSMEDARAVFERMPCHDVVSWNALIQGYAGATNSENDAILLFHRMPAPDSRTFVAALTACAALAEKEKEDDEQHKASLEKVITIHDKAGRQNLDRELHVGNSLIDVYAKCGRIADAWNVFELMGDRNVVSWTTLIQGFVQQNQAQVALELFQRMIREDERCQPNSRTFLAALSACSSLASIENARVVHAEICKRGILDRDDDAPHFVETTLVDVYGKSGSVVNSEIVFDAMRAPTAVSWCALVAGFSRSCDSKLRALEVFERMRRERCVPKNGIVFLEVLAACSHLGLIDRGRRYFETMVAEHGIQPHTKHYQCVLDMLQRSGFNEECAED